MAPMSTLCAFTILFVFLVYVLSRLIRKLVLLTLIAITEALLALLNVVGAVCGFRRAPLPR